MDPINRGNWIRRAARLRRRTGLLHTGGSLTPPLPHFVPEAGRLPAHPSPQCARASRSAQLVTNARRLQCNRSSCATSSEGGFYGRKPRTIHQQQRYHQRSQTHGGRNDQPAQREAWQPSDGHASRPGVHGSLWGVRRGGIRGWGRGRVCRSIEYL